MGKWELSFLFDSNGFSMRVDLRSWRPRLAAIMMNPFSDLRCLSPSPIHSLERKYNWWLYLWMCSSLLKGKNTRNAQIAANLSRCISKIWPIVDHVRITALGHVCSISSCICANVLPWWLPWLLTAARTSRLGLVVLEVAGHMPWRVNSLQVFIPTDHFSR